MTRIDSQILSDRTRAEDALTKISKAENRINEIVNNIDSAIIITDEGDDFYELKAFAPSELIDGVETVGGYEIETVEIIQN